MDYNRYSNHNINGYYLLYYMKVLIKHKKIIGSIMFTYNEYNRCVAFAFDCDITNELWDFIFDHFPARYEMLQHKCFVNFQKIEVPTDLSFTAFWNAYNYKIGNKERAKKLFELLDNLTRMIVFDSIKKYDIFLSSKRNMEKLYPETFLNQRRWENSFD